jgi:hypothetical protein
VRSNNIVCSFVYCTSQDNDTSSYTKAKIAVASKAQHIEVSETAEAPLTGAGVLSFSLSVDGFNVRVGAADGLPEGTTLLDGAMDGN